MDFFKKVLVLKEVNTGFSRSSAPVSAIFRLEQENDVTYVNLSVVNLSASSGEYFLYLALDKKTTFSFPLGKRPFSYSFTADFIPTAKPGYAVGIVSVVNALPTLVAYSKTENCSLLIKDFKKIVIDKCIDSIPFESYSPPPNTYDDEVVATENYFALDDDFTKKLKFIEKLDVYDISDKNDVPSCKSKEEKEESPKIERCPKNEADVCFCGQDKKQAPYYLTVKKELDDFFSTFPKDDDLERLVPNSTWVRVTHSKNRYYVVGLIKEDGVEKYICYGVPGVYSKDPPKELKGFCSFVPISVFDLKGKGYYVMFQDATDGKCVKIN